jgi:hypothetical protein
MRLFLAIAATSAIGLSSCSGGGAMLPNASAGAGAPQASSPLSPSGAASAPATNAGTSTGTSSQSIPFAPTADSDPFYAQPASFPNTTPGTIVASRSVTYFAPLGLNAKTPVGMEGYSGGSIPTMWGASIARRYAPELNIVAAATGGTVANLKDVLKDFDTGAGNALFSLGLSAMFGVNRAFPSLLTPILNAKGVAAGSSLKNGCVGNTSDGSANPTGHFADYTTIADPLDNPKVDAILKEDGLPVAGYPAPPMPLYIYQSVLDELAPVDDTDALVTTYCMQGTHVAYYVGATGEHVAFDATMAPTVFAYFASRFAGRPEVVRLGTKTCN